MFYQNEVGIGLRFPSKIRLTQICLIWRRFFWYHLRSSYHNWIDRVSDSLWDLEAKSWDRELTAQTGSLTVKLWELEGLTLHESKVQYRTSIQYVKITVASVTLPQELCWNHCSCVWAEALPIQYDFSAKRYSLWCDHSLSLIQG